MSEHNPIFIAISDIKEDIREIKTDIKGAIVSLDEHKSDDNSNFGVVKSSISQLKTDVGQYSVGITAEQHITDHQWMQEMRGFFRDSRRRFYALIFTCLSAVIGWVYSTNQNAQNLDEVQRAIKELKK
jgi:hypothetical protein